MAPAPTGDRAHRRARRMVRWYPARWRADYGDELVDVLEQSIAERPRSMRRAFDVARAATGERLVASALVGARDDAPARARAGALAVLCAWSLVVAAGVALQKYAEHWSDMLRPHQHVAANGAFAVLVGAAVVGAVAVLAGAAVAGVASWRWAREGGVTEVRRPLVVAAVADALALAAVVLVVVVSHVDGPAAHRPVRGLYAGLGVAAVVLLAAALVVSTRAVVAVGRRVGFGPTVLRFEVVASLVVAVAMTTVFVAALVWWATLPAVSLAFLEASGPGAPGHVTHADPRMLVVLSMMAAGVAVGAFGAFRAGRAIGALR
jgi:hypothetical protein